MYRHDRHRYARSIVFIALALLVPIVYALGGCSRELAGIACGASISLAALALPYSPRLP